MNPTTFEALLAKAESSEFPAEAKTRERDARNRDLAANHGWRLVTVWEHEDPKDAALRVAEKIRK